MTIFPSGVSVRKVSLRHARQSGVFRTYPNSCLGAHTASLHLRANAEGNLDFWTAIWSSCSYSEQSRANCWPGYFHSRAGEATKPNMFLHYRNCCKRSTTPGPGRQALRNGRKETSCYVCCTRCCNRYSKSFRVQVQSRSWLGRSLNMVRVQFTRSGLRRNRSKRPWALKTC